MNSFVEDTKAAFDACQDIFKRKNEDYGTANVAAYGIKGVLARLRDKLERLENVVDGGASVDDEGAVDTCMDITNYGIIAQLLVRDQWPDHFARKLLIQEKGKENIAEPALAGDVGYDLAASKRTVCHPNQTTMIPTGVRVKCPEGLWCQVVGRSSAWRQRGLLVIPGVIDCGYTGELSVVVTPIVDTQIIVDEGEKLGQLVFFKACTPPVAMVSALPETNRGSSGFGSTGA